ncbi:MAG: RluA family pseudouridine synthase [Candidatus Woesearchaeota archaeon]
MTTNKAITPLVKTLATLDRSMYRVQNARVTKDTLEKSFTFTFLSLFPFYKTSKDVQKLFSQSRIFLNGELLFSLDVVVKKDDVISFISSPKDEPFARTHVRILYEDVDIVIANKPPHLLTHPVGKYYFKTLTHILSQKTNSQIFPIHRLDRETSGIVLCAKNENTRDALHEQVRKQTMKKTYFAVVFGSLSPDKGVCKLPLHIVEKKLSNGVLRDYVEVAPAGKGKSAITQYETIKHITLNGFDCSLVTCELRTGRKHQIRAHLAAMGCPIVGDKEHGKHPELFLDFLYAGISDKRLLEQLGATRQLLHAQGLEFTHPVTNKKMNIQAPFWDDMVFM